MKRGDNLREEEEEEHKERRKEGSGILQSDGFVQFCALAREEIMFIWNLLARSRG